MWPAKNQLGAACRRLLNRSATCDVTAATSPTEVPAETSTTLQTGDTCCPRLATAFGGRLAAFCRCRKPRCKSLRSACIKTYLVLVNFSFLMCGVTLMAMGLWLYVNQNSIHYTWLLQDNPTGPLVVFDKIPFICLVSGCTLTVVSFLGCCGACTESVCFLSFYSLLIGLLVIVQVVVGSLLVSFKLQIAGKLQESLRYQLLHEYNKTADLSNKTAPETLQLTVAWDRLQIEWQCCGVLGPHDYINSSWLNNTPVTEAIFVPQSCCIASSGDAAAKTAHNLDVGDKHRPHQQQTVRHGKRHQRRVMTSWAARQKNYCQIDAIMAQTVNHSDYLYTRGCQTVVVEWLQQQARQAGYWLTVIVSLQVVGLMCSCSLIAWLRKRLADYWWCEDDEYVE